MPVIVFLRETTPTEDAAIHKAGDELTVTDASAERWIRRRAAEKQEAKPEPKQTRKEQKK